MWGDEGASRLRGGKTSLEEVTPELSDVGILTLARPGRAEPPSMLGLLPSPPALS